ncbi:hypothetical protein SCHPADRAFT_903328 [Schizopora paradoxa]|uniref:CsbD-like domain-containing protein n=1 Tax=Schizopora paradoxa TaxID=27342 RepID=A0A0H2RQY3_9AGAM|nr:hypothetical protein SCHPADRAFT_903328 [Schizopora paradoxa]
MPLFKKNQNNTTNDQNFADTQGRGGFNDDQGQFNDTGYADGNNDGMTRHRHHDGGMTGNNRNFDNDPTYPSSNVPGGGNVAGTGARGDFDDLDAGRGAGQQGFGSGAGAGSGGGYGATGATGGGTGATGMTGLGASAAHQPMAPQTDSHGNAIHPGNRGTGGQKLEGKVQSALGTMIGSQSLKAKGQAKEQEAVALKAQSAELAEAERYEQAAMARRERAVAHGAHPDHRHLGGHDPNHGAGAANVNELGGGTGAGITGAGGAGSAARGGY